MQQYKNAVLSISRKKSCYHIMRRKRRERKWTVCTFLLLKFFDNLETVPFVRIVHGRIQECYERFVANVLQEVSKECCVCWRNSINEYHFLLRLCKEITKPCVHLYTK